MNNSEIKKSAKEAMKNKWGLAIGVFLVYGLISSAISATGIGAIATGLLSVGFAAFFLDALRSEKASFDSFFKGFTEYLGTKLVSMLLVGIYTFFWTILFYIPGIVKTYSYAMTPYILLDKPELSANEAITDSRMMMRGHKMELFLLDLSFIGWILLSILTCGILFIYVVPYMQAARAEFYRTLKGENEPKADEPIIEIPH
ncbi:MAG: DUF975 family protein [Clostridia bacterium]|nr:DUF975 family protein [Clostridia bacterium]